MNYYDKHIGDYIRDTVSLSMLEDGAYNRLLDQVYQTERALPMDKKEVYRVARATSTAERKAVDYVLGKFFHATETGYMQKRAQVLIEEFWDRAPAEESKRENAKVRQQRARARRQSLFDQLREHGIVPEFNTPSKQLEAELSRVTKRDGHNSVTRDDTLTQSPVTNHQTPDIKPEASSQASSSVGDDFPKIENTPATPEGAPSRNVAISILLRGYGINATSQNPLVCLDWAENPNVTDEIITLAAVKARAALPDQPRINVNYLKPIVADLLNPPESKVAQPKTDDWAWKKSDQGIVNKGRELGMFARGGESYRDFASRIDDEIRKRKGGKA